mmetsp:Transcript_131242/g.311268  ORF Transcript_131242/g.311268 Transcript_131242/m.311268 type:complete len:85 (+) Transcript_131242:71-325(+)|eukprot:CAMPEP_0181460892 /NCGR_PEP_ID=MMETSP1110-20121109/33583_1 /TAXON_ID=174948 /ORGANISM="Symbiodinium sp., Strain CCMP421" /LENGTH=84 /DNA_ID=CAMNT_0023585473 /DNA_START=65 /DNA_END=319 /DNA_ORIENTATION=+
MMRQALRVASRQTAVCRTLPQQQQLVRHFAGPVMKPDGAVGKPFRPASPSEPEMEYVETPSMLYMTGIVTVPVAFMFWYLTRFV